MRTGKTLRTIALALGVAAPAAAQVMPAPERAVPLGPPGALGPAVEILGMHEVVSGPVVKGAPYSAEAVTEMTQTLADGNRIANRLVARVFRDGEGRTRREETLAAIGPALPVQQPPRLVFLHDPVAGASHVLEADRKIARRLARRPGPSEVAFAPTAMGEQHTTEPLGTKVIEGLEVQGTRHVTVVPKGAIGNVKEIRVVTERWVSPELQVVVLSVRRDPLFGETTYRLLNVQRAEPDQALFEIPADFTVTDGPPAGDVILRR